MSDQASALRQMVKEKRPTLSDGKSRLEIIAVTSGKGGVGKSNITMNMSIALAKLGRKVLILDLDIGTANIDILLGLDLRRHLGHVFQGSASFFEIIEKIEQNLYLVPGSSGLTEAHGMPFDRRADLRRDLLKVEEMFDYLIIDTAAGVSEQILEILRASDRVLLVSNNEPPAVVDAYALTKDYYDVGAIDAKTAGRLEATNFAKVETVEFIANNVKDEVEAREVYDKLNGAMGHFLKKELKYLGHVVHDEGVARGVINQKPLMMSSSTGPAVKNFEVLASRLFHDDQWRAGKGIQQLFNLLVLE